MRILPTPMLLLSLMLVACTAEDSSTSQMLGEMPTIASLSVDGALEISAYTTFPDSPDYGNATIYYPLDSQQPIGGVAVAPGFTERQRHVNWWGPRLASHGYAVLVLDTNDPRDRPDVRATALMAGIATLRAENSRSGSPLFGKLDVSKMAVMGHSMGGGGALLAANEHSDQIKAAIPLTPWQPDADFSSVTIPTLIIAGADDGIAAVADHAWKHFESIPATTTKVYLEVAGGDHFIANSGQNRDKATMGRYGIAWLKLYLDEDQRYRDFIYGEAAKNDAAKFSRYVTNP